LDERSFRISFGVDLERLKYKWRLIGTDTIRYNLKFHISNPIKTYITHTSGFKSIRGVKVSM